MRRRQTLVVGLAFNFLIMGLLPADTSSAQTSSITIRPGDWYNGGCTLNFVYDGVGGDTGRVFMGVAAHCTELGQGAWTHMAGSFGRTAYHNESNDVALVEVYPRFHSIVYPGVRGSESYPRSVAVLDDMDLGDVVLISGQGQGFHYTPWTQAHRAGVFSFNRDGFFSGFGAINFGDSGAPVVDWYTGAAVGSIWGFRPLNGGVPDGMYGPSVQMALDAAAGAGLDIELRTAS